MANSYVKAFKGVKGEIIEQTDDHTTIRLPVTRFGDPKSLDLHQEYFKADCYFGDETITKKFGLYEHALNPFVNEFAPKAVKAQVLGPATLAKVDEMARWFDFEIKRANEYHDYVLALNELGLLGTSTQTIPGGKSVATDGGISDWLEMEVTITPTPADYETVPKMMELAKSFGLPEPTVYTKSDEQVPDASVNPPAEETSVAEDDVDLDAAMQNLLTEEGTPTEQVSSPELAALAQQVATLTELVTGVKSYLDLMKVWVWGGIDVHADPGEGETLQDALDALKQMVGGVGDNVKSLKKAQLTMAEYTVKKLGGELKNLALMSADEREAEISTQPPVTNTPRFKSTIPDNAPGGE